MKIGVLGFQGSFHEHIAMLEKLGVETIVVRKPSEMEDLDGLIIPGGESTTLKHFIEEAMFDFTKIPIFGTCAGAIILSRMGVMDFSIERNAYGSQQESFETDFQIKGLGEPFHGIFIRAPKITIPGIEVNILAEVSKSPVLVKQGKNLAATFHPELTDDTRVHELFLKMIKEN
jgi:5'-phosphate synthase pdxT subunit